MRIPSLPLIDCALHLIDVVVLLVINFDAWNGYDLTRSEDFVEPFLSFTHNVFFFLIVNNVVCFSFVDANVRTFFELTK